MLRLRLSEVYPSPGPGRALAVPIKYPARYALLTGTALLASLALTWLVGAETPTASDWLTFVLFTAAIGV